MHVSWVCYFIPFKFWIIFHCIRQFALHFPFSRYFYYLQYWNTMSCLYKYSYTSHFVDFCLNILFTYLFIIDTEKETETEAEGEAGSMWGAWCGTWSQDSGITPWARCSTTEPTRHPWTFVFISFLSLSRSGTSGSGVDAQLAF